MTNFTTLNSDVLQIIIGNVCDIRDVRREQGRSYSREQILSFSLVSRRLRTECLPHLFEVWNHTIEEPGTLLPRHLWGYVRVLRLVDPDVSIDEHEAQSLAAEELWEAFPHMNAVTTCSYTRDSGPEEDFIQALTTLPSLCALEFINTNLISMMPVGVRLDSVKGLSRFVIHQSKDWRLHRPMSTAHKEAETNRSMILSLILVSASTLEHLELPGESAHFPEFAGQPWPRLHTLILYGRAPATSPVAWFRCAPSLKTVIIQFDRAANSPHFIVYPKRSLNSQSELPRLQSITLANPSPEDAILHFLTDAHFLAFSVSPAASYYGEGRSVLCAPIWQVSSARKALLYNPIPNLVELRLSVQGEELSDLVHTVSTAFPLLEVLELHHYNGSVQTGPGPIHPLLPLAHLINLKELRLDLNMGHESVPQKAVYWLENSRAIVIANNIPQLKLVGFLFRGPYGSVAYWRKYHVLGDGAVRYETASGECYLFEPS